LKAVFNLEGYNRRIARRKVFLTEERQKTRLAWSLDYLQWEVPDWNKVIFSDECAFNIGGRYGKTYVTRRPGEAYNESCIEPKFQRIEIVMVWGCIMGDQKGPLIIWDKKWGTITAQNYVSYVLRPQLVPYFQERREETRNYVYFQQDGAPAHRAQATMRYLQEEGIFPTFFRGLQVLQMPIQLRNSGI